MELANALNVIRLENATSVTETEKVNAGTVMETARWKNKMVLIKRYKGFKVEYNAGVFKGNMKNAPVIEGATEAIVLERIDNHFRLVEEDKKRKEEAKRLEEEDKKFLKLRLSFDGLELRKFFKALNLFTGEGMLTFKDGVMSVLVMDPANVALCYRYIKYEGKNSEIKTAININDAHNVLKSLCLGKKTRKIYVGFRKSGNENKITFNNETGMFFLPVIEYEKKEQKVPILTFDTKVKLRAGTLYEHINNAGKVKDSVYLKGEKGTFKIVAVGDLSQYESFENIKYDGKERKGKYAVEYLKKEYFDKNTMITLSYNTDYPLKLEDESGNWWILAPRIED